MNHFIEVQPIDASVRIQVVARRVVADGCGQQIDIEGVDDAGLR